MSLTWSKTPKTDFLLMWRILCMQTVKAVSELCGYACSPDLPLLTCVISAIFTLARSFNFRVKVDCFDSKLNIWNPPFTMERLERVNIATIKILKMSRLMTKPTK